MPKKAIKVQCSSTEKGADPSGSLWEVSVLVEGRSANGPYYPPEVLEACYERVNGINSYLYQLQDGLFHLPEEFQREYDNQLLGNVIGWFSDPRIGVADGKKAIVANLYIHKVAQSVRDFFKECWEHGKQIGFSITALAEYEPRVIADETVEWVTNLWFMSADPVSQPAVAGAQAIRLLESVKEVRKSIMKELQKGLEDLVKRVTPDLQVDELDRTKAVALVTQIIESLSPDLFPDAPFREKLVRLRDAIEHERDDEAKTLLDALLVAQEAIKPDVKTSLESLQVMVKDSEWDDAKKSVAQLIAVSEAVIGDAKVEIDSTELVEMLKKLQLMIEDKELEAAEMMLAALIKTLTDTEEEGEDEPPTPPEDEYPLPPEIPAVDEEEPAGESTQDVTDEFAQLEKELDAILDETSTEEIPISKEGGIMAETVRESSPVRTARLELESLLNTAALPDKAKKKIAEAFTGREASKTEMQNAIIAEADYLKAVGVNLDMVPTEVQRAVDTAVQIASQALEAEISKFRQKVSKSENETKSIQETIQDEISSFKQVVTDIRKEADKARTAKLLETLVPMTPLPKSSVKRVMEQFSGTTATEVEIKEAIQREATMANEVLGELTSTVLGFGSEDVPSTEEEAISSVESFFADRLGVTSDN